MRKIFLLGGLFALTAALTFGALSFQKEENEVGPSQVSVHTAPQYADAQNRLWRAPRRARSHRQLHEYGVCRNVINHGSQDVLVPFKSRGEWTSFLQASIPNVEKDLCKRCEWRRQKYVKRSCWCTNCTVWGWRNIRTCNTFGVGSF